MNEIQININRKKIIGFILIVIIFIFLYIKREQSYNDLLENKETTIGTITDFSFSNYNYILYFEYHVDGVKYEKSIVSSFFRCDDGTDGCVGKKFKVIYSRIDPTKCDIDIGKFNKNKGISF